MNVRCSVLILVISIFCFVSSFSAEARNYGGSQSRSVTGSVQSGGAGLAGYSVTLYASYSGNPNHVRALGNTGTDRNGNFTLRYRQDNSRARPVLYLLAERGSSMLATVAGEAPVRRRLVINERTTVATAFAFAQFVKGRKILGNYYGVHNAVEMAGNMADPYSGDESIVLRRSPNGSENTGEATFNSLANMVAACIESYNGCHTLFQQTTLPGEFSPGNVLQAVANIAKYPWLNVGNLFNLSLQNPLYGPALPSGEQPDTWAMFIKFTGSFSSEQDETNVMNGPGNFAIDEKGSLWVLNNYVSQPPDVAACASPELLRFQPWGEVYPGSPYSGGGVSGAGFGITFDPLGLLWLTNFGFAGTGCPVAPSNSASLFLPNGIPLSGPNGFTEGNMYWPQGMASDQEGSIWIANCGNDSVTWYPHGDPLQAQHLAIPTLETVKPFGVGIDHHRNAWVSGSFNSSLMIYDPEGNLIEMKMESPQLARPMGIAVDSEGHVWVSNSDWMDMSCPPSPTPDLGPGTNPSIALFKKHPDRDHHPDSPFSGGGLTLPWGIAVDGNDTVWVANFGFPFDTGNPGDTAEWTSPNRVSHFCGMDTSKCPSGKQSVGQAISPNGTGYSSDALKRNTGLAIDPSGNVWLVNNWKEIPEQTNPGENAIVVMVGAAAPVNTPIIGPVQAFGD